MKKKLVVLLCLISLVMLSSCSLERVIYGDAPSDALIDRVLNDYYEQTKHIIEGTNRKYDLDCIGKISFEGETYGVKVKYTANVGSSIVTFKYTMKYLNHTATVSYNEFHDLEYNYTYDGEPVSHYELEERDPIIYRAASRYNFYLEDFSSIEGTSIMSYGGATVERTISFDGSTYIGKMNYDGKRANGKTISYTLEYIGSSQNYHNNVSLTAFKINDRPLNYKQLIRNSSKIYSCAWANAFLCID